MQKYVKNYLDYHGLCIGDLILCEVCGKPTIIPDNMEIHHIIYRSQGGSDEPENLIALCAGEDDTCHSKAHRRELTPEYLTGLISANI